MADEVVIHDTAAQQFRIDGGEGKSLLQYRRKPGVITFLHSEVPEALQGRGIAGKLAKAGLEFAREERLAVVPRCPFVAGYIERHPEYQSLVKAG